MRLPSFDQPRKQLGPFRALSELLLACGSNRHCSNRSYFESVCLVSGFACRASPDGGGFRGHHEVVIVWGWSTDRPVVRSGRRCWAARDTRNPKQECVFRKMKCVCFESALSCIGGLFWIWRRIVWEFLLADALPFLLTCFGFAKVLVLPRDGMSQHTIIGILRCHCTACPIDACRNKARQNKPSKTSLVLPALFCCLVLSETSLVSAGPKQALFLCQAKQGRQNKAGSKTSLVSLKTSLVLSKTSLVSSKPKQARKQALFAFKTSLVFLKDRCLFRVAREAGP